MRIAVTGASGAIGSHITRLLAADPGCRVIALSPTRPALPDDVPWAGIDYAEYDGLRAALRGVDTLVFVSSDGPVAQVIVHHKNVIDAAASSGVAHIVAMSGLDADLNSPVCYAVSYGYTEQLLRDSGCAVSIARTSIYTEFFMGFLRRARTNGELRIPAAGGRISLVSRADVGRCLAALAVAELAERQWGTPIKYVDVAPAEFCTELARAGEDPWWIYAFSTMFESIREHRWAAISADVDRLTGQTPMPFRDILAANQQPVAEVRDIGRQSG